MSLDSNELQIVRDVSEMKADMRTVKHDIVNIQAALLAIGERLNKMDNTQARGLGFFAGAAFILTAAGGFLLTAVKLLFGGNP